MQVSSAAKSLCMWARAMYTYDKVAKNIGPKKEALAQAEGELAVVQSELGKKQEALRKVCFYLRVSHTRPAVSFLLCLHSSLPLYLSLPSPSPRQTLCLGPPSLSRFPRFPRFPPSLALACIADPRHILS